MKNGIELILQHGWAYDSNIWSRVKDVASVILGDAVDFITFDRGYFLAPRVVRAWPVRLETRNFRAVICHSFGLHLLPEQIVQGADAIVIVGGFLSIHSDVGADVRADLGTDPRTDRPADVRRHDQSVNKRSRGTIMRMLKGLTVAPHQTVFDFHNLCGALWAPDQAAWEVEPRSSEPRSETCEGFPLEFNVELLAADLRSMDESHFDLSAINPATTIAIVHGKSDPVVPFERAERLHSALANSKLVCVEDGGHSLPITHPKECLRPLLESLSQYKPRWHFTGKSISLPDINSGGGYPTEYGSPDQYCDSQDCSGGSQTVQAASFSQTGSAGRSRATPTDLPHTNDSAAADRIGCWQEVGDPGTAVSGADRNGRGATVAQSQSHTEVGEKV